MKTMTLAQWLHEKGYPAGPETEDIWIGQALSEETALQIRRMANRAYLDSINCGVVADWVEFSWPCNVPFLTLMIELMDAGTDCDTNWRQALYDTMSAEDLKAIIRTLEEK